MMAEQLVQDDLVVAIDYVITLANGELVDTTEGEEPLEILQGGGEIIPGMEQALYGMRVGESKHVVIPPETGFGPYDAEAVMQVPRGEFPPGVELVEGMTFYIEDDEGDTHEAHVAGLQGDTVLLDFNHPLARETLHADITVRALRDALPEELEHGHAHGAGEEDDEEWEDDDVLWADEVDEEEDLDDEEYGGENGRYV